MEIAASSSSHGPDQPVVSSLLLLPAAFVSNLLQPKMQGEFWIGVIFTGLELAIGVWLARQGENRTIAFIAVVLVVAVFSSFGLNAMVRA